MKNRKFKKAAIVCITVILLSTLFAFAAPAYAGWISSGGNIICNLPVEKVVPGN